MKVDFWTWTRWAEGSAETKPSVGALKTERHNRSQRRRASHISILFCQNNALHENGAFNATRILRPNVSIYHCDSIKFKLAKLLRVLCGCTRQTGQIESENEILPSPRTEMCHFESVRNSTKAHDSNGK